MAREITFDPSGHEQHRDHAELDGANEECLARGHGCTADAKECPGASEAAQKAPVIGPSPQGGEGKLEAPQWTDG